MNRISMSELTTENESFFGFVPDEWISESDLGEDYVCLMLPDSAEKGNFVRAHLPKEWTMSNADNGYTAVFNCHDGESQYLVDSADGSHATFGAMDIDTIEGLFRKAALESGAVITPDAEGNILDAFDAPRSEAEALKAGMPMPDGTTYEAVPESTAKTADDVKAFEQAAGQTDPSETYVCYEIGPGKAHYEGTLGSFDFDTTQFALARVKIPASEYGAEKDTVSLLYRGNETDGRKIKIPDGINDISNMFEGTAIESVPAIPEGVVHARAAFKDCAKLEEGGSKLPSTLRDMDFMYANCNGMKYGPNRIPKGCETANYAFVGCGGMVNTPAIKSGMKEMDGMFAGCKSLTKSPSVPRTVTSSRDTTYGCTGIDKQKDAERQASIQKARAKYEKKLNRKGFGERVGNMFSACMQCHAMRKMGYGIVMAPIMTHMMRKNGQFGKNASAGFQAAAMVGKKKGSMQMARMFAEMSKNSETKKQARREEQMAKWDRLYGDGTKFSQQVESMSKNAAKDQRSDLFERISRMAAPEKQIYKQTHGKAGVYEAMANQFRENVGPSATVEDKKNLAGWYKKQMESELAYYKSASDLIGSNAKSAAAKKRQMAGLGEIRDISTEELVRTAKELNDEYQIFNEGDQRDMDRMMKAMGCKESIFGTEQQGKSRSMDAPVPPQIEVQSAITPDGKKPERTQPEPSADREQQRREGERTERAAQPVEDAEWTPVDEGEGKSGAAKPFSMDTIKSRAREVTRAARVRMAQALMPSDGEANTPEKDDQLGD